MYLTAHTISIDILLSTELMPVELHKKFKPQILGCNSGDENQGNYNMQDRQEFY